MKRTLATLLALALVLGLAACGGKSNTPDKGDGQQIAGQPEKEDDTAPDREEPDGAVEPDVSGSADKDDEETLAGEPEAPEEPEESGTDVPEETGAAAVTASHTDVTFRAAGDSFRLTPRGTAEGHAVYASADPSIAGVAEDGTVTAVAPGTTTISMRVEDGGIQQEFTCIIRCAWKAEQAAVQPSGEKKTLPDFFAELQAAYGGLGSMRVYDGELLDNYYAGLSGVATEQMLVQETMISMANCAVALIEVSDSADVETVKDILAARAKTQAEGGAWYPASCETWEQAVIVSTGNFVGMFVCPDDAQAMADAFTAAYGD